MIFCHVLGGFVHLHSKQRIMNTTKKLALFKIIAILLLFSPSLIAQSVQKVSIGFYNLENLFDTINTAEVDDIEFTPESAKKWNTKKYYEKLDNMARAISGIATDKTPEGLAIVGLCEIENKEVIIDLINHPLLKARNYQVVHYNSPDKRGIDVALIYQANLFTLENSFHFPLTLPNKLDFYTRDQLLVGGKLLGEQVYFLVNHWPSRSGGEEKSIPLRNAAGDLSRSIVDFVLSLNANAKIMVMGDLNDDPHNASVSEHFKASGDKSLLAKGYFFNPYALIHKPDSYGTLGYRGKWNLFDQIMLSPALLKSKSKTFSFSGAYVYDAEFLKNAEGTYKGLPFRTFAGNTFLGGYSDHLPVYIILEKK